MFVLFSDTLDLSQKGQSVSCMIIHFVKFTNHQSRHKTTNKMGGQPSDCRRQLQFCVGMYGPGSLMAEWLEQTSQWHEMYCHDLDVMSSDPSWVERRTRISSALSRT